MSFCWAFILGLAFTRTACHAFSAEVNSDLPGDGVSVSTGHLDLKGDKRNELGLVEMMDEEALQDDEDDDEGDGDEDEISGDGFETDVAYSFDAVTKSLPAESVPKNVILSDGTNGLASYAVEVNYYDNMQHVRVLGPSINDVISLGPNVDTQAIATEDTLIVGSSIHSDMPGRLVVFNGQDCQLRTYPQGTPIAQPLAAGQCSRLRAKMERDRREIAAGVAGSDGQNLALAQATPLTHANPLGQAWTYPTANYPSGQTGSNLVGDTNSNGQTVDVFGQTVSPTGQTSTPAGQTTNPFGMTATPTGQTVNNLDQSAPAVGQTVTYSNGRPVVYPLVQTVAQTNPYGQTYSNTVGQNLQSNDLGQGGTQASAIAQNLALAQYISALGGNWPFAASSFLNGGISPFGSGDGPYGRRPRRPFRRRGRPGPRGRFGDMD